mgnify:CR=1 FL=1|jgi:2-amino-4-hydroxy-6-hydroxymethyldihydropteridine diphosphokinase
MRVFLGIGSNLEPETHIQLVLNALRVNFGSLQLSSKYRTPAIGFIGPSFINMAVSIETELSAAEVAEHCQRIERELGRDRSTESGSCSRCIDIDLLLFEDDRAESELPQPRADIRDFAYTAVPLADLMPDWRHDHTGGMRLADYIKCVRFSEQQLEIIEE